MMVTKRVIGLTVGTVLAATLTVPSAGRAADELPSRIDWTVGSAKSEGAGETVQLGLSYRTGKSGQSQTSNPIALRELQGLTTAQLASDSGTPARFRIARQAGSLDCEGVVRRERGTGECRFTPDARFPALLEQRGIGRPTPRQQLELAVHGADLDVVDELNRQGYARPTISDLVEAGIFNVDVTYLRSLDAAGYRARTVDKLVEMKIHGVSTDYIRELAAIGPNYRRLPVDKLVAMRIHGVTSAKVRELARLGYDDLTPDQLIEMSIHGVTPAFVGEMAAAGYRRLTPKQLVTMRIHGVDGEMARRANAAVKTRN